MDKYTIQNFPLEDKRGVEVKGNSFEVNFPARGRWFTKDEEAKLKEAGMVSQMGLAIRKFKLNKREDGSVKMDDLHLPDPYYYSRACAGYNELFFSLEDYIRHHYADTTILIEEWVAYYNELIKEAQTVQIEE